MDTRYNRLTTILTGLRVFALLLNAPIATFAQTTFPKITTGPVVTDGADGEGCAWVDFNGDGLLDLYVSCDDTGANLLYRNDGNGVFTKLTMGSIQTAGTGSIGAAWADFDNDGRIDLFVSRQDGGPGLLFRQQADGTFTRSALTSGGFSRGAAWADYDHDGFLDLMVGDTTQNVLWHNNGQSTLVAVSDTPIVTTPTGSNLTWVDYDNDGDIDLFVARSEGVARLYQNNGQGVFTPIADGGFPEQIDSGTGSAWGDYDNDGFPDLFLCRLDGNFQQQLPSFLFHNNGNGTFSQVNQSPFTNDTGFSVTAAWADYDNDGWLDLIVTDFSGKGNCLYHNKGGGTFERVLSGSIVSDRGSSAGAAWGDYDRDGFLDLFVANGTNGGGESKDYLYHNNGNSNAWITIKLVGTVSNRSAIGAKVRLKATINGTTFWQLREVNTGNSWSQSALEAHFGLGDDTNVDLVRIEWPSGIVQTMTNVAAKQFLTVVEHQEPGLAPLTFTNLSRSTNGTADVSVAGDAGLRYLFEASTNLVNWTWLSVRTNLTGSVQFTDTAATNFPRRFYRVSAP